MLTLQYPYYRASGGGPYPPPCPRGAGLLLLQTDNTHITTSEKEVATRQRKRSHQITLTTWSVLVRRSYCAGSAVIANIERL